MAANIKLKRSAVQSRVPTTSDLELGELGLNTYDGKVYMKKDDGTAAIVEVGGDGAVSSVNTLTGAVSLGIEDMDDFTLASASGIPYDTWDSTNTPAAGEWHINSSFFYLPKTDSNGADQSSNFRALDGTTSLTITQGGTDYVITNADLAADQLDGANARVLIEGSSGVISSINSAITKSGGITISCPSFSLPLLPLADGDILQWVNADSKFKPVQLPAAVSSIDDLSDVDTSTAAPTEGQVLTWDNTASKWEPGTVAGNAVDSVNSQTGVVVLDADDIDDTTTAHKFATSAQLTDIGTAVQPGDLAAVATSGAYSDLSGTPATAVPAAGGTFTGEVTFSGDMYNNGIYTAVSRQEFGSAFDLDVSNYHYKNVTSAVTVSFSGIPSDRVYSWTLELDLGSSGSITWPGSVDWPGGTAPTIPTSKKSLFMFVTRDGGSTIYGSSLLDY